VTKLTGRDACVFELTRMSTLIFKTSILKPSQFTAIETCT